MAASTSANGMFQKHLKSSLKIPEQILNDVAYCQRAFGWHISVRKFIEKDSENFGDENGQERKELALEELERDISTINAEMQYLFVCLRKIRHDFYTKIQIIGVTPNTKATTDFINNELNLYVNDKTKGLIPYEVTERDTKEMLMTKYVYDSEPEENVAGQVSLLKPVPKPIATVTVEGLPLLPDFVSAGKLTRDMTDLLTPLSSDEQSEGDPQLSKKLAICRMNLRKALEKAVIVPAAPPKDKALKKAIRAAAARSKDKALKKIFRAPAAPLKDKALKKVFRAPAAPAAPPKDKALKKAIMPPATPPKDKAPKKAIMPPATPPKDKALKKTIMPPATPPKKKGDMRQIKPAETITRPVAASGSIEILSSSDNQKEEVELVAPQDFPDDEPIEIRNRPEDYSQEDFMRLLGLCTHAVSAEIIMGQCNRKQHILRSNKRYDNRDFVSTSAAGGKRKRRAPQTKLTVQNEDSGLDENDGHNTSTASSVSTGNDSVKSPCHTKKKSKCNMCGKVVPSAALCCDKCSSADNLAYNITKDDSSAQTAKRK